MSFTEFLEYASGPGVAVIVSLILSWAIEYVPQYDPLPPKTKRVVFATLCFLVPLLAALVRVAAGHVELTWDPLLWQALVAGAAAAGIGTLAHTPKLHTAEEARVARFAVESYRKALSD